MLAIQGLPLFFRQVKTSMFVTVYSYSNCNQLLLLPFYLRVIYKSYAFVLLNNCKHSHARSKRQRRWVASVRKFHHQVRRQPLPGDVLRPSGQLWLHNEPLSTHPLNEGNNKEKISFKFWLIIKIIQNKTHFLKGMILSWFLLLFFI